MRKFGVVLAAVALLVMVASVIDVLRFGSLKKRALLVKTGASKSEVQRALGRPTSVLMPYTGTNFVVWLLSVHSETWAYGSTLDVPSVLHGEWPFHFRLFGPDSNDVVVVFGSSGRVAQVVVP